MAELLPSGAFVLGRSTLNIAVGSMQVVAYGVGGLLLIVLSPESLFLVAAGSSALAALLLRIGCPTGRRGRRDRSSGAPTRSTGCCSVRGSSGRSTCPRGCPTA
jgi:hypothetical protein